MVLLMAVILRVLMTVGDGNDKCDNNGNEQWYGGGRGGSV